MIKKILLFTFVISMISCGPKTPKELTTPSGYKYSHVTTDGQKVSDGDFVSFTIRMEGSNGTVLQEMGEGPQMPKLQMPTPEKPLPAPNPVVEMLQNGAIGDSLTLIMPIDSFPNASTNPQLAGMEYVKYVTCITKIQSEAEHLSAMEELRLQQEKDMEAGKARLAEVGTNTEKIIKDYKAGKLDVKTTDDNLKYVILSPGEGPNAEVGQRATVHYYGAFLDGKMFDSSFRMGKPYTFTIGRREVISGWDLGIPLLNKGATAALFIPYDLAYGAAGNPPTIPEKTDLMFYVELVDIQ